MKDGLSIVLALIIGVFIGFFVFVSVFADGSITERLITISIILLSYIIISALWGFLLSDFSWLWGIIIGTPGVLFILQFFARERDLYLIIYIILILGLSSCSAKGGSYIRARKKNKG